MTIEKLVDAVGLSLSTSNWHAALFVGLALPDITSWVDEPEGRSSVRYPAWVEKFLAPKYTILAPDFSDPSRSARDLPPVPIKMLSGSDCYALRCAMLHEGRDDISTQRARDALRRFRFLAPRPGWHIHRNQMGPELQLQVDLFCQDICAAVHDWRAGIGVDDQARRDRLRQLLFIQEDGSVQL